MVFNSVAYFIYFTVVLLFYFIIPHKLRWLFLLSASYFFYMCLKAEYSMTDKIFTTRTQSFLALMIPLYAEENGVKCIFISRDSNEIFNDHKIYADERHLNRKGAMIFSEMLCEEVINSGVLNKLKE